LINRLYLKAFRRRDMVKSQQRVLLELQTPPPDSHLQKRKSAVVGSGKMSTGEYICELIKHLPVHRGINDLEKENVQG